MRTARPDGNPARFELSKERTATDTRPITPETEAGAPWPKWMPLLEVGVLVAALAVVGFLATGPSDPVEVAERYMAARDAYDVEVARSLVAPDAQLRDMPEMTFSELDAGFEVLSVYQMSYDRFDCVRAGGDQEDMVTCTYQMDTALNDPVGYPPVPGRMDFRIADGKIVELRNHFPYATFSPNVFDPFTRWVYASHGQEGLARLMDQLDRGPATPRLDQESIDFARIVVSEYRQSASAP